MPHCCTSKADSWGARPPGSARGARQGTTVGTLFGSTTSGASVHPGRRLAPLRRARLVVPVVATPTAATAADDSAPVVTNSVTATYDVDHAWQVFNAVDRNRADAPAGGTATVSTTPSA